MERGKRYKTSVKITVSYLFVCIRISSCYDILIVFSGCFQRRVIVGKYAKR
jgi:hypothetical protein